MKKNIELSSNIEALFGTRDENLHVLEDGLNINIDLRSDRIELEGAPRDVARAEQLFADYEHLRKTGHQFVNGDLSSMLRVVDPAWISRSGAAAVVWTANGPTKKSQPAPLSRSHRAPRHGLWSRPRRHGQDLSCRRHGHFGTVE
jgi:phosphate starvation-inducible PhoH-like protein